MLLIKYKEGVEYDRIKEEVYEDVYRLSRRSSVKDKLRVLEEFCDVNDSLF